MKPEIHPKYEAMTVTCACGNTFQTRSTIGDDLTIEICSECHPFFTGKQKLVDTAGRVDRFKKRFARRRGAAEVAEKGAAEVAEKGTAEVTDKSTAEVAEKSAAEVTEKSTAEVAEKGAAEVAEKSTAEVAEKSK